MSVIFGLFNKLKERFRSWRRIRRSKDIPALGPSTAGGKFSFASQLKSNKPLQWLIYMLVWFFGLLVVFCIGFKYIEQVDWEEAIWQGWQTFTTVGYGNAPPETTFGRLFTIVLSTFGIAIVGAVFSAAFDYSSFLKELKQSGFMKNPYRDGYVIFNLPKVNKFLSFIRELRSVEPDAGICIVDNRIDELPKSISTAPKVHFIRGNTLSQETYQNANIKENKTVVIFPQDATVSDSDGATKITVDLLERFVGEDTRLIHVLVDPANAWMFANSKSTPVFESFELWAIVQECQDPYSALVVENLLLNTQSANPHTVKPIVVVGWLWRDLVIRLLDISAKYDLPCTPWAIIRNGETLISPPPNEKILSTDLVSIIANNDFDWPKVERYLKNEK